MRQSIHTMSLEQHQRGGGEGKNNAYEYIQSIVCYVSSLVVIRVTC